MASLTDGLGEFFAGESTLKIDIGISSDSMVKLAIIVVVAIIASVVIIKIVK